MCTIIPRFDKLYKYGSNLTNRLLSCEGLPFPGWLELGRWWTEKSFDLSPSEPRTPDQKERPKFFFVIRVAFRRLLKNFYSFWCLVRFKFLINQLSVLVKTSISFLGKFSMTHTINLLLYHLRDLSWFRMKD